MATTAAMSKQLLAFMDHVHNNILGGRPMFRHEYYCDTLGIKIYCNEVVGFFCCICSDD